MQTPEILKQQIRNYKVQGLTDLQIKNELNSKSWNPQIIEQAIRDAGSVPMDSTESVSFQQNRSHKATWLLLGIFITGCLSMWQLIKYNNKKFDTIINSNKLYNDGLFGFGGSADSDVNLQGWELGSSLALSELGLEDLSLSGNGAEDFFSYFTYIDSKIGREKPGRWSIKFGDTAIKDVILEEVDLQALGNMANKKSFEIYPAVFNRPVQVFDLMLTPVPKLSEINLFQEKVLVYAEDRLKFGETSKFLSLTQDVLRLGRRFRTMPYTGQLYYSMGLKMEIKASQKLLSYYQTQKKTDRVENFKKHLDSLTQIQNDLRNFGSINELIRSASLALFKLDIKESESLTDNLITETLKSKGLDRAKLLSYLQKVENSEERLVQLESLLSVALLNFTTESGLFEERQLSAAVLEKLQSSKYSEVKDIVSATVKLDREQISQLLVKSGY